MICRRPGVEHGVRQDDHGKAQAQATPYHPDRDIEAQKAYKKTKLCQGGPQGQINRRQTRSSVAVRFADEARFGRINCPRPCWAPPNVRPAVASRLICQCSYLYGAVSPKDGVCAFLILPSTEHGFLDMLAKRFSRWHILLIMDATPNPIAGDLVVPINISLECLPPYSLRAQMWCSTFELNLQKNTWEESAKRSSKPCPQIDGRGLR